MSEIVVDNFAGGGGASTGIEAALGRPVEVAINHDPEAVALHQANHPGTLHFCESVWQVDPRDVLPGRPVGLGWFSPDCKHFSKAKGGRPVEKSIRGLAWIVLKWAGLRRPRVIMLENVEEFADWGPLTRGGRPCKRRRGMTFRQWAGQLEALGYRVEWRELRACDYGAPTVRRRLFVIARCDGQAIVWPRATHGPADLLAQGAQGGLLPWRTAGGCIDWSLPTPSIFGRPRPLAEATLRRIARGVVRFVLEDPAPFIVTCNHGGEGFRGQGLDQPFKTLTAARDAHGLVAPFLVPRYGERPGQAPRCASLDQPAPTIVPTGNGGGLVAAFLAQHNTGMTGHRPDKPLSTIVGRGSTQGLVAAFLSNQYSSNARGGEGRLARPMTTVTAGGQHQALVAAFLMKYYGTGGQWQRCADPLHAVTTRGRFGVVTVTLDGQPYELVDIGMRMLTPRELFRAQGFPDSYVIDPTMEGPRGPRPLPKTAQTRMCGNSVCPDVAEALVRANLGAAAESAWPLEAAE